MGREVTHMVTPIKGTERDESVSVMRRAAEREREGRRDRTYVWRGWQPSWCPRTKRRGTPRQLLEGPSQRKTGTAGRSMNGEQNYELVMKPINCDDDEATRWCCAAQTSVQEGG